jgi:hypothetical protein
MPIIMLMMILTRMGNLFALGDSPLSEVGVRSAERGVEHPLWFLAEKVKAKPSSALAGRSAASRPKAAQRHSPDDRDSPFTAATVVRTFLSPLSRES